MCVGHVYSIPNVEIFITLGVNIIAYKHTLQVLYLGCVKRAF